MNNDRPFVFPLDDFLAMFPEFADTAKYQRSRVQSNGLKASMHIFPYDRPEFPLKGEHRRYALFLMTAHLIELDDYANADGQTPAGIPFKSTVGSVTVENTKPNSFTSDDWNYWLSQTKHGRELLAFLDTIAMPGIFINTKQDSVRDLL